MPTAYLELNKNLTEEEASVKDQVHRFAEEVLRPAAAELDQMPPEAVIAKESVLWDVFRHIYKLGYHTRSLPEEFGGVGLSPLAAHVYGEEMGWGASDLSISLGVAGMPFFFAAGSGNQELIQKYVIPFSQDRDVKYVGCWGVTEPQHGSDAVFMGSKSE